MITINLMPKLDTRPSILGGDKPTYEELEIALRELTETTRKRIEELEVRPVEAQGAISAEVAVSDGQTLSLAYTDPGSFSWALALHMLGCVVQCRGLTRLEVGTDATHVR